MRIDDGVKREVLARTDIGEFIGNYVPLRKRGNDLVGLCPFHAERTPSFHVHPDRGFFKCFGCGVGGDVLTFYQRLENVPFPEALRTLAKRAGIEVEPETAASARVRSEKEQIYAANELAAAFFHRVLRRDAEGAGAREYCCERGLADATIDAFKLGFAPASWEALERELRGGSIDPEMGVRAGLLRRGQHGYYSFYRGRLMIPTYAATGEVVAFGGRALDGSEPKYLNTGTTPVYTKGRGLYALNVARRSVGQFGALIVVEGYLDCIALHQAGLTATVASLGTAFTAEQAAEIRKYTERAFICFDADGAGGAATAKSVDLLVAAGVSARIVQLPARDDPDTFVRREGRAGFDRLLEAAVPWIEYSLDRAISEIAGRFVGPAEIVRRAEALVQTLPRAEWDRWRVYVAGRLGLAPDDLRASAFRAQARFAPRDPAFVRHASPAAEPPMLEREILSTLLEEPPLVARVFRPHPARALPERGLPRALSRAAARGGAPGLSRGRVGGVGRRRRSERDRNRVTGRGPLRIGAVPRLRRTPGASRPHRRAARRGGRRAPPAAPYAADRRPLNRRRSGTSGRKRRIRPTCRTTRVRGTPPHRDQTAQDRERR